MKHTLTLFAMLLVVFTYAADEWTNYYSDNSVQIFYRYTDCHDDAASVHQQKVVFKFVNLTAQAIAVNFNKQLFYSGQKQAGGDKPFQLSLQPKQSVEGSCNEKDKTLFSFVKHLNMDGAQLQDFKLTNISITTIP